MCLPHLVQKNDEKKQAAFLVTHQDAQLITPE